MNTLLNHRQQKNIRALITIVVVFTFFVAILAPSTATAMTADERRNYAYQDIAFIDDLCGAPSGAANATSGRDNIQRAYNYFVSKGLKNFQSAGIVGNLRQESQMDPTNNQPDGPGMGLAQWSEGGRWEDLKAWAASNNREVFDLDTQLDFIWHEMNNVAPWNETLAPLRASTTVESATQIFESHYERAGTPVMANRIKYAREVLAAYGGDTAAVGAADTLGVNCEAGGIMLVDGYMFPVDPRTKRDYTNMPCKASQGEVPGMGSVGWQTNYTDRYGHTTRIRTCHHDGSPAFDLMYGGVAGKPIYAITDGWIVNVNRSYVMDDSRSGTSCQSLQFQSGNRGGNNPYYWYGHIQDVSVNPGQKVKAGDKLGVVATSDKGPRCWGGGPHLHIDRGCKDHNGRWQNGGYQDCRDPGFLNDLRKVWEALPPS